MKQVGDKVIKKEEKTERKMLRSTLEIYKPPHLIKHISYLTQMLLFWSYSEPIILEVRPGDEIPGNL